MRILTFAGLYPSEALPRHGLFVEQRLRRVVETGEVEAVVVSPVPWFPLRGERYGRYGAYARVAREERRHGIRVLHPRYPVIPKAGMTLQPWLMRAAVGPLVRRLAADGGGIDLIDAHYFYPDGVAAVALGRALGIPVVVTARGTDVNLIPEYRLPRRAVVRAARGAAAVIAVSEALGRRLVEIGVDERCVTVLRNGVDLECFRPLEREAARRKLSLGPGPLLLSVGNLLEDKGHHLAVEALRSLPEATLAIVGEGGLAGRLRERAVSLGVADRVRLEGGVPQERLPDYYGAADALVLASVREGMPNVVLESLACGTPVIATAVGGIPEVLTVPAAGVLLPERSAKAIADAARRLLDAPPDRDATRRHAEGFGWEATTAGQLRLFRRAVEGSARRLDARLGEAGRP